MWGLPSTATSISSCWNYYYLLSLYQQLNKIRRWAKHFSNTTYAVNFLPQSLAWFWPRLNNIFQKNSWVLSRHYHKPGILPTAQLGCNQTVSDFSYVDGRPGGAEGFWGREWVLVSFLYQHRCILWVQWEQDLCPELTSVYRKLDCIHCVMAITAGLWESSCWMRTSMLLLLPYVWVFFFFA